MGATLLAELLRLRRDFEQRASQYPDLTLSLYFIGQEAPQDTKPFRQPNHTVMLWQYMGNFTSIEGFGKISASDITDFGMSGALLSAFGLIEGPEASLFRRMAYRAGSLVPTEVIDLMNDAMVRRLVNPSAPGKPVIASNNDPLSVWLNLVLLCTAVLHPERVQRNKLPVDPYTASLTACDFILNRVDLRARKNSSNIPPALDRHFRVSLTYPRERGPYVAKVADGLRASGEEVFFDGFFEPELASPNLDLILQRIYHDLSDLIVVFLCKEYEQKEWCGLEWRALRDLIKKRRGSQIMLMRFDDVDVSGLYSIDGYIDLRSRSAEEAVQLILRRLTQSTAKPTS